MCGRVILCVLALFAVSLADHHEGAENDHLEEVSKNNTQIWSYISLFRNAVETHFKEMSRRIQSIEHQVAHMNHGSYRSSSHSHSHTNGQSHGDDHHHQDDSHDHDHHTTSSHGDDQHSHSSSSHDDHDSSHDDHHGSSSHDDHHGSSSHDDHHGSSSHDDHHGSSSHDDHHGSSSHDDHHGSSSHEGGSSHDDSHHHSHETDDDQQKENHGDHHGNHEESHHSNQQMGSHHNHHHHHNHDSHRGPSLPQHNTTQKEVSEPMMSSVNHKNHHDQGHGFGRHNHNQDRRSRFNHHHHKTSNNTTKFPKAEEYEQYVFGQCEMNSNTAIDRNLQQNVRGQVSFFQKKSGGPMGVHVRVSGFNVHSHGSHHHQHRNKRQIAQRPSENDVPKVIHRHGFHVHASNDLSRSCESLGPHFNPNNMNHGSPSSETRHIGDLGNIECDDRGFTNLVFTDEIASLVGPETILDRGLIIHANEDDLGSNKDDAESLKTGNAGTRIACCIIHSVSAPSADALKYSEWAQEYKNDV